MNPTDEEGIEREAWRRRFGEAGSPSPLTDARIRAAARRALTPRTGRWWLPASLAASLMLAVFVVQWQVEDDRQGPFIDESDMIQGEAPGQAPEPELDAMSAPAAQAPEPMIVLPATEAEAPLRRDESPNQYTPAPTTRKERASAPAAESAADAAAPAAPPAAAAEGNAAPAGELGNTTITGTFSQRVKAAAQPRTPEQWYADIEALRAAGKHAEAEAELMRLEEAHPGWLARRQSGNP